MASSSLLSSGLRWLYGLLVFSSSMFEVPAPENLPNPMVSSEFRTAYHFQPSRYWMNDPNAPMYYKGLYHFFYQHNPDGPLWTANISWGHSVSTDLIHWTALELALTPSRPFDISGCWSGSATILPGDKPVIVYTGLDTVSREVQNVAYPKDLSDPFLRQWTKPDYNPIIVPFEGIDVTLFRDPSTAWQGKDGLWRLIVGTVMNGDGKAILYRSHDFATWVRAEDPLHFTNGSGMWECVDFVPLGDWEGVTKYLLKVSMYNALHDHYTLGTYDEERDVFVGDDASSNDYRMWPRVDYGSIYASKTFFDGAKNRRIWWGWSNESDSAADDLAKGWAGIQAVPRVFTLDRTDGKRLIQWPVEELESLRREKITMKNIELRTGSLVEVRGLSVSQADVEVEFELPGFVGAETFDENWIVDPPKLCREKGAYGNGGVGPFGLLVLAADNLEENTAVYFRVFRSDQGYKVLMCADQRRSSKRNELYKPASGGFVDVDIKKDGKISLRTLIDHSVVESFGGGGRTVITSRVYPTLLLKGNTHVYAFNYGTETVKISELNAWNMSQAQIS